MNLEFIFKVIDKNSEASLLELKPITGRKHQLRKQLYAIGNPIFGDTKYKLSNSDKGINKNLMLSYHIDEKNKTGRNNTCYYISNIYIFSF